MLQKIDIKYIATIAIWWRGLDPDRVLPSTELPVSRPWDQPISLLIAVRTRKRRVRVAVLYRLYVHESGEYVLPYCTGYTYTKAASTCCRTVQATGSLQASTEHHRWLLKHHGYTTYTSMRKSTALSAPATVQYIETSSIDGFRSNNYLLITV